MTEPGGVRRIPWTPVVIALALLSGCSHLSETDTVSEEARLASDSAAPVPEPDKQSDAASLSELMVRRHKLCAIGMEDRLRLLSLYRGYFVEEDSNVKLPGQRREQFHQLDALLLASCSPARTPGVLGEMLLVVNAREDWPLDYREFFDLLTSQYRAYYRLDRNHRQLNAELEALSETHRELQRDFETLQLEHEKTIRGISEIERGID